MASFSSFSGLLAMEAARAALKGGVSVLEVMMSTPDALMVIQGLVQENPCSIIGAGTVLTVDDARKAMSAGAKFLTSPGILVEILQEVEGSGVLYAPGVLTPTEVLCAYEAGAKLVKVYPATILGGGRYISALKRSFPHIPMVASQGISIDNGVDHDKENSLGQPLKCWDMTIDDDHMMDHDLELDKTFY